MSGYIRDYAVYSTLTYGLIVGPVNAQKEAPRYEICFVTEIQDRPVIIQGKPPENEMPVANWDFEFTDFYGINSSNINTNSTHHDRIISSPVYAENAPIDFNAAVFNFWE